MDIDKEKLQKKIGLKIKSIRDAKGISQEYLAAECGFLQANVARLEAGGTNPTLLTLTKIANCLEVSITELVNLED